jgi:V/A-type H+-transporting ATPase subunit I
MIVKMMKVTVVTVARYANEAIAALQKIGVMHIVTTAPPSSPSINTTLEEIKRTEEALEALGNEEEVSPSDSITLPLSLVGEILSLRGEREGLSLEQHELNRKLAWYERWGEVVLQDLVALRQVGVYVRLYATSAKETAKLLTTTPNVHKVGGDEKLTLLALLSRDESAVLSLPEERIPEREFADLTNELHTTERRLAEIAARLSKLAEYKRALIQERTRLQNLCEFERAREGLDRDGELTYLRGYVPVDAIDAILHAKTNGHWAYSIQEPGNDDEPPTMIRTPKWLRTIEPLFRALNIIPGYTESDVSLPFLVFFTLFFAMLVADGGYGVVLLMATLWLWWKKRRTAPWEPFALVIVLSVGTIVWGALTGVWFGFEELAHLPILRSLIIPDLSPFNLETGGPSNNEEFIKAFCFAAGAIHLGVGHLTKALRYAPSIKALAQVGWMVMVGGVYFLVDNQVLGTELPTIAAWLLGIGSTLVLLFEHPNKNPLKAIGGALMDLPLETIEMFSHIISYIRLFAIGLGGFMLAETFNKMAIGDGVKDASGVITAALVLSAGHLLNLAMAILGVAGHGVRLKMLEFSRHTGNTWSGDEYSPLKESR